MTRLTPTLRASIRRGELTDYAVEACDGRVGRLSSESPRCDDGLLAVELGPYLFGPLVVVPLEAVRRIDPDTETIFLTFSKRDLRQAQRLHR